MRSVVEISGGNRHIPSFHVAPPGGKLLQFSWGSPTWLLRRLPFTICSSSILSTRHAFLLSRGKTTCNLPCRRGGRRAAETTVWQSKLDFTKLTNPKVAELLTLEALGYGTRKKTMFYGGRPFYVPLYMPPARCFYWTSVACSTRCALRGFSALYPTSTTRVGPRPALPTLSGACRLFCLATLNRSLAF